MAEEYAELSKAKIKEGRNLVISLYGEDKFTLAQQVVIQDGHKEMKLFLKGAIHIDSIEGLYNLRDAANEAIQKFEKN